MVVLGVTCDRPLPAGVLRLHMERSGLAGLPQYASYLLVRAQALMAMLERRRRRSPDKAKTPAEDAPMVDLLEAVGRKCLSEAVRIYSTAFGPTHRQTLAAKALYLAMGHNSSSLSRGHRDHGDIQPPNTSPGPQTHGWIWGVRR